MRRLPLSLVQLVALLCAMAVQVFVWPLGLSMELTYVWFLAFVLGALAAAIGAGWVGTIMASDDTRSRLLLVFAISEATAAVVAIIGFLVLQTPLVKSSFLLSILSFLVGMGIVVLGASWASVRFRSRGSRPRLDALATLGLLVVGVAVYYGTLLLVPVQM